MIVKTYEEIFGKTLTIRDVVEGKREPIGSLFFVGRKNGNEQTFKDF